MFKLKSNEETKQTQVKNINLKIMVKRLDLQMSLSAYPK